MIKLNNKYKPLWTNKTRYFVVTGGRGSSKSYTVNLFLENLTWEKGHKILFTRYTLNSAQISIIPEFKEKIEIHTGIDKFDITKTEITNKHTGSQLIFRGIKTSSGNQTANLKSIQGITTFVLDEAEELDDEETFDKIDESVRQVGIQNRVIIVLNPAFRKHWIYKRFFENKVSYDFNGIHENVTYIHTTYEDNKMNLSESFIEKAELLKASNIAKFNHRFGGMWVDEVSGALWHEKMIKKVKQLPEFKKIIVAVDPSATGKEESDDCGIICMGQDAKGDVYVYRDETAILTPLQWGNKIVYLHNNLQANCVVAEVNQGWDMVKTIINQIDPKVKVVEVVSKRGKTLRAEPVVALYEQGRVFHLDGLAKLEYEMTTWTPDEGYSPGRIDALVHGVTYLFDNKKTISFYD